MISCHSREPKTANFRLLYFPVQRCVLPCFGSKSPLVPFSSPGTHLPQLWASFPLKSSSKSAPKQGWIKHLLEEVITLFGSCLVVAKSYSNSITDETLVSATQHLTTCSVHVKRNSLSAGITYHVSERERVWLCYHSATYIKHGRRQKQEEDPAPAIQHKLKMKVFAPFHSLPHLEIAWNFEIDLRVPNGTHAMLSKSIVIRLKISRTIFQLTSVQNSKVFLVSFWS